MNWVFEIDVRAIKELKKLDRQAQQQIRNFLNERIADSENPRRFGNPLQGDLSGLWHFRVGDYRILCQIQNQKLIVLVVGVGYRREVYM